jgi:hypothetical protein
MSPTVAGIGRSLRTGTILFTVSAAACSSSIRVASTTVAPRRISEFKTFTITAPPPATDYVVLAASNDSGHTTAIAIDMDPMLETSMVGRAMRRDLRDAFGRRGYRSSDNNPDFYVAYYAGTGHVVDTRASLTRYHHNGERLRTQIVEYPAGTIVLDVVDARTDSLVWRGTALADIPQDPNDYARAIRKTVDKIAQSFPKAQP